MTTMVEMIEQIKQTINELEELKKKNVKARKELEEEAQDIEENLGMWKEALDKMEGVREKEIGMIMADKPAVKKGSKEWLKKATRIIMVDEKGNQVKEYESMSQAEKDLGLKQGTIWYRMKHYTEIEQIDRFTYAFIKSA